MPPVKSHIYNDHCSPSLTTQTWLATHRELTFFEETYPIDEDLIEVDYRVSSFLGNPLALRTLLVVFPYFYNRRLLRRTVYSGAFMNSTTLQFVTSRVLIIDNYDSFVYTPVSRELGHNPIVLRNDKLTTVGSQT